LPLLGAQLSLCFILSLLGSRILLLQCFVLSLYDTIDTIISDLGEKSSLFVNFFFL